MNKKIVFADGSASEAAVRESLEDMATKLGVSVAHADGGDTEGPALSECCSGSNGVCSAVDGDCSRCPVVIEGALADVESVLYERLEEQAEAGYVPGEDECLDAEDVEALARIQAEVAEQMALEDDCTTDAPEEAVPADAYEVMLKDMTHAERLEALEEQAEAWLAEHPETLTAG